LKESVDPVEEIEYEFTNSVENISLNKLVVSIENQQNALIRLIDTFQVLNDQKYRFNIINSIILGK
jgi:hypothetical protein